MAEVYDFLIHRTARLLSDLSQQNKKDQCEIVDCQTCLEDVVRKFESSIKSLRNIDQNLGEHQRTCERVQVLSDECLAALDSADLEELIEYRKKYLEEKRGKAGKA